ncbi:hypothetical protein DV736_g1992, partial [Chaetothyriales sp. CBS 134916]
MAKAAAVPAAISDFEAQRLANIAERNALLKQLNLQSKAQVMVGKTQRRPHNQETTKDDSTSNKKRGSTKGGQQQPAAKRIKRERLEFSGPRRTSSRLAGIQAGSDQAEEADKALLAAAAEKEEQERIQRLRRQEDIEFQGSLVLGTDVLLKGEKGKYERTFDFDKSDDKNDDGDVKALRERMNKLALWDAFEPARLKVVPERIYAMLMHPTEAKPIVFAGDKAKPSITTIKPHTRTISAMHTHPSKPETVYTASYDSSIRATDLHKSLAVEIYGPVDPSQDEPLSGVDMADTDVNVVYFTTLNGSLGIHDTRTRAHAATTYQLSDKKIGGFSLNPLAPHYLATASLDRTMKLWDLRKITVDDNSDRLPTLVAEHESRLSVSHAAFNAAGQVATSSYDDTVKIYSFGVTNYQATKRLRESAAMTTWPAGRTVDEDLMKPEVVIRHNNQTGRWVTILRPQWQRHPTDGIQKFVIGNMNRFVDVYAADGSQLAQLGDDEGQITAVPAVAVWHDRKEWVAGGNASGKVYLWI